MTLATDHKILERLAVLEGKDGPLPEGLELYRRLLRLQSEAGLRIGKPEIHLDEAAIRRRTAAGAPMLGMADLSVDWSQMRDILLDVASLFSQYATVPVELSASLKDPDGTTALLKEAAELWFEGVPLPSRLMAGGTDEAVWGLMLAASIRPFLTGYSEALLGLVQQEQWRRGYCPICGGSPDFAFLDKERGARWLLCSRCDAEWLFKRLECPYCSTQDQNVLAYLTDDNGLYRLYVCERCRHYLKAIDLRQADAGVLLPLERLLTVDIDTQAQKDGYSPLANAEKRGKPWSESASVLLPESLSKETGGS